MVLVIQSEISIDLYQPIRCENLPVNQSVVVHLPEELDHGGPPLVVLGVVHLHPQPDLLQNIINDVSSNPVMILHQPIRYEYSMYQPMRSEYYLHQTSKK